MEISKEEEKGEERNKGASFVRGIPILNQSGKSPKMRKTGEVEMNLFIPHLRMSILEEISLKSLKRKKIGESQPAYRAMVYLLHRCYLAPHISDGKEDWATISSKYMSFICNDARTWADVWKALEAHKVIECDPTKVKRGKVSYRYRLTPEWRDGVKWEKAAYFRNWPDISGGWREIPYLDFDRKAAAQLLWRIYQMRREVPRFKKKVADKADGQRGKAAVWVESRWDERTFQAICWRIEHFSSTYRICRTGRLFTDANSLPKELRSLVMICGEPTVELDVVNCQPLLLWTLYSKISPESARYRMLVESGRLYETVRDMALGADYEKVKDSLSAEKRFEFERNNFKNRYFIPYLFGEGKINKMKPKIDAWLAEEFPELLNIIRSFKGPKALPRKLQELESNLIWKTVDAAGIPHLSVHDGVRVRERDVPAVMEALQKSFATVGLQPNIKQADVMEGLLKFEEERAATNRSAIAA